MEEAFAKKKINILIVDTPGNIQSAADILSTQGYQVAFGEDGKRALLYTKILKFDLILLDIVMPDGYEVCRCLKDGPGTEQIPVIFLAARDDTESIVKGFEAGAADYVAKPFSEAELLARVNTHLELSRHRNHLEQLIQERIRALNVMTEVREEISAEHEEKIRAGIFSRIFPMVETLRGTLTRPGQNECLDSIESGIREILSEFSRKLSSAEFSLTSAEIRMAGLIREGKCTKQIADLLCISENTVTFHRRNIRKKLGLTNRKISLKSFLKSVN